MKQQSQCDVGCYQQFRQQMQDGDVLLFKGQSWLSKIIKWRTKSAYSHAGIVVWWSDRLMVLEAVGKGVLARPISYNLNHYEGDINYYRPTETLSAETRKNMALFAQEQLGKEYATKRLVGFFFKLLFNRPLESQDKKEAAGRYFCSEYVADIYSKNGLDLDIERGTAYTSPDRLANSKGLQYVVTLNKPLKEQQATTEEGMQAAAD